MERYSGSKGLRLDKGEALNPTPDKYITWFGFREVVVGAEDFQEFALRIQDPPSEKNIRALLTIMDPFWLQIIPRHLIFRGIELGPLTLGTTHETTNGSFSK